MAGAKLESPPQPALTKGPEAPRRDSAAPERRPALHPMGQVAPPLSQPWRPSSGQQLAPDQRARLTPTLGEHAPLAARIHTGRYAELVASAWSARAVTIGEDIFFAPGEFRPGTPMGQLLLAHEVAHVEQARQGALRRPAAKRKDDTKGDAVEAQADAKARAAVHSPAKGDTAAHGAATAPAPLAPTASASKASPKADAAAPQSSAALAKSEAPVAQGVPGPLEPSGSSPVSPETDPAFQGVKARVKAAAQREQKHDPAANKAADAQAAAVPPGNEVEAKAGAQQVDAMATEKPKPFSKDDFKKVLLQKIAAIAPTNLEQAEQFKKNDPVAGIRNDVQQSVQQGKDQAQGGLKEKAAQAPDPSGTVAKAVIPLPATPPGAASSSVNAGSAAPKSKSEKDVQTRLAEPARELDQQMADAEVTDEQLARANESKFTKGLESKSVAKQDAVKAPGEYRQAETQQLTKARVQAEGTAQTQLTGMHDARAQQFIEVVSQQGKSKTANEKEQSLFVTTLTGIYQQTKQKVEDRLKKLDGDVNKSFEEGAAAAQGAFVDYIDREVTNYKIERYLGRLDGALLWARDLFKGLPPEVNQIYEAGKNKFIRDMDTLLDQIATLVETGLNEAIAEVTRGKAAVEDEKKRLGRELSDEEKQALGDIQGHFDDLTQSVVDKQSELIDGLTQKYQEQRAKVDTIIEERQKENRGLIDKAKDLISGIIETIKKLKDMLLGVLARAAGVIGKIIKDPIGFLGNLVAGAKAGFVQFVNNIGTHLMNGLMGWLLGALGNAGIDMSGFTLDGKGILRLVLQVLGLTYANIRGRAVQIVGEPVVKALETASEIIMILVKEGPAGLWRYIKDVVGDLKEQVLGGIKDFIITKIITAGVTWVLSLLNPASAFIKACKMIYDVVMFFIERASQIAALVNAVLDTLEAIVDGNIAAMANKVEAALAKAVPVVISFLAALLGVTGISDKIAKIIQKVRAPIDKAIDWVIHKAVDLVKKAGKFLLGKVTGKKDDKAEPKPGQGYDGHVGKEEQFSAKGHAHRIWIQLTGGKATIMVASTPTAVDIFLNQPSVTEVEKQPDGKATVAEARSLAKTVKLDAQRVLDHVRQNNADAAQKEESKVESGEERLLRCLRWIFEHMLTDGKLDSEKGLVKHWAEEYEARVVRLMNAVGYDPKKWGYLLKPFDDMKRRLRAGRDLVALAAKAEELKLIEDDLKALEPELKSYEALLKDALKNRAELDAAVEDERKGWKDKEKWEKVRAQVMAILADYKSELLAAIPGSTLWFRGSLATGWKGPPKVNKETGAAMHFNPSLFDCDAYVQVPIEFWKKEIAPLIETGQSWAWLRDLDGWHREKALLAIEGKIVERLKAVEGYQKDKGQPHFEISFQTDKAGLKQIEEGTVYPEGAFKKAGADGIDKHLLPGRLRDGNKAGTRMVDLAIEV